MNKPGYIIRMQTKNIIQNKKVMLVKKRMVGVGVGSAVIWESYNTTI